MFRSSVSRGSTLACCLSISFSEVAGDVTPFVVVEDLDPRHIPLGCWFLDSFRVSKRTCAHELWTCARN